MKSTVDKLVIGKLETTPVGLHKLSNVVKTDIVKKTEYDESVIKLKKLTITQKLMKFKINLLLIIININIRNVCCKIKTSKFSKQN